jgi:protocatechuate 3,4-dioxygenase beta subunit
MTIAIFAVMCSLIVYVVLTRLDNTDYQLAVLPVAAALIWLAPGNEYLIATLGVVVGAVAYLAVFVRARGQRVAMPPYVPSSVSAERDVREDESAAKAPPIVSSVVSTLGRETPSAPDGPYYIPGTPEKRRIAKSGTVGEPMRFLGQVLSKSGAPVDRATIEVWHADGGGDYDNSDFNCRGHQFTDAEGRFEFETVRPFGYGHKSRSLAGIVDYRSAHIHVKIRTNGETFTTQVWFPGDPRNPQDIAYSKFEDTNVVRCEDEGDELTCRFDFVV